jgi:signal transduction histidine kinase
MQTEILEQLGGRSLPRFTEDSLENDFRDFLFESKKALTRNSLILAAFLFAVVEPIARTWVPSDVANLDNSVRWLVNVPATLITLAAYQLLHNQDWVERVLLACLGTILLGNALLLWSSGAEQKLYYAIASVQITLFGFFLLGLRFRLAFLCMLLCFGAPSIWAFILTFVARPEAALQSPYLVAILIFFGLAFAAHSLDVSNRTVFLVNLARSRDYTQRIELEKERSRWLKTGSDYLNHEVKNALLGMSSSLNLIKRRNKDETLTDYIERAESSTTFMKRLLGEVSASTSLESALDATTLEITDLADLLSAKVAEYHNMFPHHRFDLDIVDNIHALCDIDRVVQMLDKLVDNATEHCDPNHAIRIRLERSSDHAVISIANVGEPLADSQEQIFEPFVSGKARSSNGGFGFGLYVVKRIAQAHGGTVTAKSLTHPEGAEFVVQLPLHGSSK